MMELPLNEHGDLPMTRKRWVVTQGVILFLLAGSLMSCGTYRPLNVDDAQRLNPLFQERMGGDGEMRSDVVQVGLVVLRGRGLEAVVVINGKTWSDKSRTQQERLVKKIGAHMQDALFTAQPDRPRSTFTVLLRNDIREDFGFIIVGGSNDQGVVYRVSR
jgi:hypothetical protein